MSEIETIDKPAFAVIGLVVRAHWQDLHRLIPETWDKLFARQLELTPACGPLGPYLEASLGTVEGVYKELLGVTVLHECETPKGMERVEIPAGRYLRTIHDGPLIGITEGFHLLINHATKHGMLPNGLKLDIGYTKGLPAGRHELFVGAG
jgi:predicted transcriptional regulator YdeE